MHPAAPPPRGRPFVTAVIVAHDGARWLPRLLSTLEGQTRLPDRLGAVDTGSEDGSAELLRDAIGSDAVFSAQRDLGFGAAVQWGLDALGPSDADDVEHWVWVLHDDMRMDPRALEGLLAAAAEDPSLAVVGPKVREWPQRRRLLEMGLTATGTGRRLTGVERGEYDQGQHDHSRPERGEYGRVRGALAVGSAGMLVRREAWDRLGGFDPDFALFGDDLDLGWRASRAGLRCGVAPDALVFHVEAAARGRRSIDAARGRPHRLEREGGVRAVLLNCRAPAVPLVAVRLLLGTLVRAFGLLLLKSPRDAWDELTAFTAVARRPWRLLRGRRRRARTIRRRARVRPLLAPWWTPYGQGVEVVGQVLAEALDAAGERTGRSPGATETGPVPEEAQNLEAEPGLLARTLRRPLGLGVLALVLLSLLAGPGLLGSGMLQGGALLPAPPGATDWWRLYGESWHPVTLGSDAAAPPYVAVLAFLATLLLGKAWLLVDVLFGLAVPLTALCGYALARSVVRSRAVALWAALTYGLLPVLTGAVGQGRVGTVVAAMVAPLVARCAVAAVGASRTQARWRGAVGAGVLLAVLTAFVPLALPMALALAAGGWLAGGRERDLLLRLGAALLTCVLLLLPWLATLGLDPAAWASAEAGFGDGVAGDALTSRWAVALGRPGGPAQAPAWLTAGLVLAAAAALLRTDRRRLVLSAWAVGLVALGAAVVQVGHGDWPGFPVLLAQGAAVVATAALADGVAHLLAGASFGWRQPLTAVVVVAALLAPVLGAGWWLLGGGSRGLEREPALAVPSFMADAQQAPASPRTLVLSVGPRGSRAAPTVHLSRGAGVFLGLDAVAPDPPERLSDLGARLLTEPTDDDVAALAEYGVGFVLLTGGNAGTVAAIDGASGLVRSSAGEVPGVAWRLDASAGPVRLGAGGDGLDARVLPSRVGEVETTTRASSASRSLTLGERANDDWRATLGGEALSTDVTEDGSQAFDVPRASGELVVEHDDGRGWWLLLQSAVLVIALVLAAPGRRRPDATR